jgi:hypothetical protein
VSSAWRGPRAALQSPIANLCSIELRTPSRKRHEEAGSQEKNTHFPGEPEKDSKRALIFLAFSVSRNDTH